MEDACKVVDSLGATDIHVEYNKVPSVVVPSGDLLVDEVEVIKPSVI